MSITRRSFLKATVAAGTLAATTNPLLANDKKGVTTIPHASNVGAFYADVKDGKLVALRAQEAVKG